MYMQECYKSCKAIGPEPFQCHVEWHFFINNVGIKKYFTQHIKRAYLTHILNLVGTTEKAIKLKYCQF